MSSARPAGPRWRAPRQLRITTAGRVYLVLSIGVGVGALNTGNNLLYLLLGLQLGAVVVSGLLSERCLRGLRVERVRPDGLTAGEPGSITYRVTTGGSHAFGLSVAESALREAGSAAIAHLGPGETRTVRAPASPVRRGPLHLSGVTVTTLYPLGLFAKSRTFDLPETAWVYPRRRMAIEASAPGAEVSGDALPSSRPGGGGDLLDLRALQPFEDARRVHWLKSAAAGQPLHVVREQEQERTVELAVPAGVPAEALDVPCERTAALADRYLAEGFAVGLTTDRGRLAPASGPTHAHRILELLARAGYPAEAE